MAPVSIESETTTVMNAAQAFAAQEYINKEQLKTRILLGDSEIPALLSTTRAQRYIAKMQEAAFCEVISISNCKFHKKNCECDKTMLFGQQAEVCMRASVETTMSKCKPELKNECSLNSLTLCDSMSAAGTSTTESPCLRLARENAALKHTIAQMLSTLIGETPEDMINLMGHED
jgi:hypothetical protein